MRADLGSPSPSGSARGDFDARDHPCSAFPLGSLARDGWLLRRRDAKLDQLGVHRCDPVLAGLADVVLPLGSQRFYQRFCPRDHDQKVGAAMPVPVMIDTAEG